MTFQEGSRLRRIGNGCFQGSDLEEFVAPPGLKEIGSIAFYRCKGLKRVVLNEDLEVLADKDDYGIFQSSGVEEVTLPSTLREIGQRMF